MTQPPQPTERFAQHPRLAELVTALGFRRYRLFLAGLLYQEPGGPLRQATAVVSRDGDLVAYDTGEVVEHAGRVPTSRLFDDVPYRAVPNGPGGRLGRAQPGILRPRGGRLDRGPPQRERGRYRAAAPLVPARAATTAITHSEVLGVVPLEITDAVLDEFRRLADRHQRGCKVEQVLELLATS
jgi:hypothetical protein